MPKAYRQECLLALVAFVLAAFLTHIYPIYFLFPGLTRLELFGFPAHYFLTLFLGWVVLMPLYWIYMQLSEKIDREIAEFGAVEEHEPRKAAQGGAR
ncbi:MAG: hypothetical protein Kow0092_05470 [Deferrisomatales bacterium]